MLTTQQSCVFIDSISLLEDDIFIFILTKHDVITSITSNYEYDVIYIMTFCNCNVIVRRLIFMFITRV